MFQYFRCFGWIKVGSFLFYLRFCFNTSDVSVEYNIIIKNIRYVSRNIVSILQMFRLNTLIMMLMLDYVIVSILQMFRLNFTVSRIKRKPDKFQYFRCFGWIPVKQAKNKAQFISFNTSDVSVECDVVGIVGSVVGSFNTSDVSVEF